MVLVTENGVINSVIIMVIIGLICLAAFIVVLKVVMRLTDKDEILTDFDKFKTDDENAEAEHNETKSKWSKYDNWE